MTPVEWGVLAERLGHVYPAQALPAATVDAWYDELACFDAPEVWQAIRHLIRTRPRWLFDAIANILDAIDELDRQHRAEQAQQGALQQRARRRPSTGSPPPPEFKAAVKLLERAAAGEVDRDSAREAIGALADQLHARIAASPTRPDADCPPWALRTCPECATSPIERFIPVTLAAGDPDNPYPWPVEAYTPCPGCNPK